jgi:hypothetical protein
VREYGKVFTSFWTSETTKGLSDRGRVLGLYLLSSPHTNMIGCFRLPDGYVAEDLDWSSETVAEGFAELSSNGFITRDPATKWVLITAFLKWNEVENPNQGLSAIKLADQVPASFCGKPALLKALHDSISRFKDKIRPDIWNPFETLCETVSKPGTGTGTGTGTGMSRPPAEPTADQKGGKEKETETALQAACKATWIAYSKAYFDRYGTEPVRNAKVNANVKQFVQRIPYDEAPQVAAWFVSHPKAFYVTKLHEFGLLLADAESLRTEWATGRHVTATSARQSDRTASNFQASQGAAEILRAKGLMP